MFHPHPDNANLVQVELRFPHPSGKGWYEQFDELPESNVSVIRTGVIFAQEHCDFWSPLQSAIVPKKRYGLPWVPILGKPCNFER
jgi:hypothetical protein